MVLAPKKRLLQIPTLFFLFLVFFFYRTTFDPGRDTAIDRALGIPRTLAANETLGFGAVLVVSKQGSRRRHALIQAANVTDIELTIPRQPKWTEEQLEDFSNGEDMAEHRGSMLAWLGHHNVLKWFLHSGLETALILEDDVDFDIRLRSVQIPLAARAARALLPPAKSRSMIAAWIGRYRGFSHYWGNPASWDLLYIGHCGDYFHPVSFEGIAQKPGGYNLSKIAHATYHDPTFPRPDELHPFTQSLMYKLRVPYNHRVLHRSQFPLCSFGYAVTRAAAERLLDDLAPARLLPTGPRAFDVALLQACVKGSETASPTPQQYIDSRPELRYKHKNASPGLRCWTVNPELFHHMPGESEIARVGEETHGAKTHLPPVDQAAQQIVRERNETANIGCGFWSGEFSFNDGDMQRLRFLREHVGRKGECLKPGRESI
ncbi:uncharacterized protein EI97DRAFT_431006 [Westerdykella ornata]|uniref:Glycosyltransferase family 25 protein n=1 Tax=Westerdykella ornata TaxID=318751 RepID=A0A6A6JR75_WESOR|nr:uncharacterized protein EI97DRAFT_431006 [Westerdykella ornata]KAF2278754.1 hypothetical protein EI97DRAFT_431006 [Westerdykella ornata]